MTTTTTRGSRSLFANLLFDEPVLISAPERKGRNELLVEKRNELLVHRHYFLIKIKGLQYGKSLETLEAEFFLAQRTIVNTMVHYEVLFKNLKSTKPDVKYFRQKYPWLVWD